MENFPAFCLIHLHQGLHQQIKCKLICKRCVFKIFSHYVIYFLFCAGIFSIIITHVQVFAGMLNKTWLTLKHNRPTGTVTLLLSMALTFLCSRCSCDVSDANYPSHPLTPRIVQCRHDTLSHRLPHVGITYLRFSIISSVTCKMHVGAAMKVPGSVSHANAGRQLCVSVL